ncbi:MAG: IS110 family transposase [Ornithinimicrobium sp.]
MHARSVAAAAIDGVTSECKQARLTPSHDHIRSWISDLVGPVAVTYEAGPTGFGLSRVLNEAGVRCVVAAPSKLQRPSGDRVKTDAKDAVHLAKSLRLGEVTAVTVASADTEAARDLVRARDRLSKLLLRHGQVYTGGKAWTGAHDVWLRQVDRDHLPGRCTRVAFESDYDAVLATLARRDRLDTEITAMATDSEFTPVVTRPGCLRGVATLTVFALAVEIGDWDRFDGNTIGSFVGLVPSERSSGASRSQGSIIKTGNSHARRLLVEAAWHHRARYVAGKTLRDRWDLAGPAARARGEAGNRRLHTRWARFTDRRRRPVIANVAIARELAGWCWSLAVLPE